MIKQTISKNLLLRLSAQADEAEIYGNEKLAKTLTDTIVRFAEDGAIRKDDSPYEYREAELREDVRVLVWSAAMRVFDYYENLPDTRKIDEVVNDLTYAVVDAFENIVDGVHKGEHEPKTPGEQRPEPKDENIVDEDSVTWKIKLPEDGEGGRTVTVIDDESKDDDESDDEDEDNDVVEDDDEEEIVKEGE